MYYTCFFKPTQPFSTESVKYFAFFNPFYVQNFIRIHLHFSFYSQHRLTINIKILWFPGLRPKITAADLKKYRGEGTYCAMEMRLKNCRSLCWHNFRFQRLLGMVCTMESKEMIFPRRLHNLLPQISPLNHLDKIPYPYYHKDTFSKRYRFSFSKSLMAFRHTFSEIKLLNFCRGKARVNLIWDFIRYIRQRFWVWK